MICFHLCIGIKGVNYLDGSVSEMHSLSHLYESYLSHRNLLTHPAVAVYIINKSAIGIINTAFSPVERGFRYGTEF
jgi:hypothetical protein